MLDREKKEKETIVLHGDPIYRETLELKVEDRAKLLKLLGNQGAFRAWSGEKKCGGFHPDYCIECGVSNSVYRVLVCFGCWEVKVYGPENSLRCDIIHGDPYEELWAVLKKYRKNRPPSQPES